MQDARDSRRNKNTKRDPHPPENQGETTGKTRQGDPTHPEEQEPATAGEGENTARGNPPTQKKEREAPLGDEEPKRKQKTLGKPRLVKGGDLEAEPQRGETVLTASLWGQCPLVSRKRKNTQNIHHSKNEHSCRSCHPALVVENNVMVTMHSPPNRGPKKNQNTRQNKAQSLKGSENHI